MPTLNQRWTAQKPQFKGVADKDLPAEFLLMRRVEHQNDMFENHKVGFENIAAGLENGFQDAIDGGVSEADLLDARESLTDLPDVNPAMARYNAVKSPA